MLLFCWRCVVCKIIFSPSVMFAYMKLNTLREQSIFTMCLDGNFEQGNTSQKLSTLKEQSIFTMLRRTFWARKHVTESITFLKTRPESHLWHEKNLPWCPYEEEIVNNCIPINIGSIPLAQHLASCKICICPAPGKCLTT